LWQCAYERPRLPGYEDIRGQIDVFTYLADVGACLARCGQKLQAGHPFSFAQTGFPRKVMEMSDESLQDVFQSGIRVLRVDQDDVIGDVFYIQIL